MSEISVRVFERDLLDHTQYHVPMFQLISTNMDKLFHQDSSSNGDAYQIYFENRIWQTSITGVKTAIAFDGNYLCGFFQYSINDGAGQRYGRKCRFIQTIKEIERHSPHCFIVSCLTRTSETSLESMDR